MQKTLGGDRLGSGKKMKVNLHGYERSTHDTGYLWRSTMSAGTLVPFMCEVALPGDTFDISLNVDIKTHPTTGPLFGSYKVQLDTFVAPIRLYNSWLHNNRLGVGLNMSQIKLPVIRLTAVPITIGTDTDVDNMQINPSCVLSYLGIRGIGIHNEVTNITRDFNAIPILMYWDIYKNYYSNKQEEIGMVVHTPAPLVNETVDTITIGAGDLPEAPAINFNTATAGTGIEIAYIGTPPILSTILVNTQDRGILPIDQIFMLWTDTGTGWVGVYNPSSYASTTMLNWSYQTTADGDNGRPGIIDFPLTNIDLMRDSYLSVNGNINFNITDVATPYSWLGDLSNGIPNILSTQEGLGLKTYQSDLFNNWLSTEWIDGPTGINAITAIDTSAGSFNVDTLILARKVYDMLNRIAVSGGTYDDWVNAAYGHEAYRKCETPMYMGGLIRELVFQEVVSNSSTENGEPLGTLAGKGVMSGKRKGGDVVIKVDEPSYIMGIISLTPRVDYSQGNKWDVHLKTLDDLHKPALDQIGFQEDITEQRAWWDTHWDSVDDVWVQKSAGKQPAWINYMTNVNQTRGNFARVDDEMFMTLNRRYEYDESLNIQDLTTYIDPSKFNFIFADTALDAQNFWAQISVDITARRKMSAKIMPNL